MTLDLDKVKKTYEYIKILVEHKLNLSNSLELIGKINSELYAQEDKLKEIWENDLKRHSTAQERLVTEKKNNDKKYEQKKQELEVLRQSDSELYEQEYKKLEKERKNSDNKYEQQKKQKAPELKDLKLSTTNAFEAIKAGIMEKAKLPETINYQTLGASIAELELAKYDNSSNTKAIDSLQKIISELKSEYEVTGKKWEDSIQNIAVQKTIQEKIALAQEQALMNNVEEDNESESHFTAIYTGFSSSTVGAKKGLFTKMSTLEPIMDSEVMAGFSSPPVHSKEWDEELRVRTTKYGELLKSGAIEEAFLYSQQSFVRGSLIRDLGEIEYISQMQEQGDFDSDGEDNLEDSDDEDNLEIVTPQEQLNIDLHSAIHAQDAQRVKDLLAKGADPSYQKEGYDALHIAVQLGLSSIVQQLITKGALLDAPNKIGMTPLSVAASNGYNTLFDKLIEAGAKTTTLNIYKNSLLHLTESTPIVKKLLAMGLAIDHPNKNGDTPLIYATLAQNVNKVRLLLQEGADVNHITIKLSSGIPLECYTPLQYLVEHSRHNLSDAKVVEMVKLFIAYGAEVSGKALYGPNREITSVPLDSTNHIVVEAIEKSKIIRDVLIAKGFEVNQNQDKGDLFYKIINSTIDKIEVADKQLTPASLIFVNDITKYLIASQSEQMADQQDTSSSQEQPYSTKELSGQELGVQLADLVLNKSAEDNLEYPNATPSPISTTELKHTEAVIEEIMGNILDYDTQS